MSEENAPKLRLKPKLAADPVNAPQLPPAATPTPPAGDPSPRAEPKSVRLKPKLAADPAPSAMPPPAESAAEMPIAPPAPALDEQSESSSESEKPAARFTLKPRAPGNLPPPETLPSAEAGEILPAGEPIPAPALVDSEGTPASSEAPSSRTLTSRPFPPPPGNFPAPPTAGTRPAAPWAQRRSPPAASNKKKMVVLVGGCAATLLILGGGFFAYRKFTTVPSRPAPGVGAIVQPKSTEVLVPAPEEKARQETVAPTSESTPAPIVGARPEAQKAPEKTVAAPEVVEVPPPPPPTMAFKAWVDNLRIGGVRTGTAVRVFIGGTAYAIGDTVNQQLGIVFDSYNAETRRLIFKDKTGAIVERRN